MVAQGQSYPTTFLRNDSTFQDPISNNFSVNNPQYPYKSIFVALLAALGLTRTLLTTATTFYVATNGSDSNNGLTSGAPWLTFAHAMSVLTGQYDFGGQNVTLQANAGHANFTAQLAITPWVGGGTLTYDGGGGQISTTSADAISVNGDGIIFTYRNVKLITTTSGSCLNAINGCFVHQGIGVNLGASAGDHLLVQAFATLNIDASYTISGNFSAHVHANGQGGISTGTVNPIVTLTGTPAGTYFAYGSFIGFVFFTGSFSGASTITFKGFSFLNSAISDGGQGGVTWPGTNAVQLNRGGVVY